MNQQQIETTVSGYLMQAVNGATLENPKLDFKREWYNLSTSDGVSDFLCDTSAIANTFGLDGYIVIGFDDKAKAFTPSPLSACRLPDPSQLMNIISKHVDPIYTLNTFEVAHEGNSLSVLHIPPSINKPHFIRNYTKNGKQEEQRIFVRKNSINHRANRSDIELMYYDRKNILPEYSLEASCHSNNFQEINPGNSSLEGDYIIFPIYLTIENIGRRPVSITKLTCTLSLFTDPSSHDIYVFDSGTQFLNEPLIILANELDSSEVKFKYILPSNDKHQFQRIQGLREHRRRLGIKSLTGTTSQGTSISIPWTVSQ